MVRTNVPLPPQSLRFMNEDDERFLAVGDDNVSLLRSHAGLTPTSFVADIGSGYGRLAHGLLRWVEFKGRYLGLDILKDHIAWCNKNLRRGTRWRFAFKHLDIRNGRYNPKGRLDAKTVRLPIPDASVDVAVLLSVFTHMYPDEVRHYLSELRRILAADGRASVTILLLNEEWERLDKEDRCTYKLVHRLDDVARYMEEEDPLHAIGYDEIWFGKQVAEAGLAFDGSPIYGTWAGRDASPSFQDMVVLRRA